MMQKMLIVILMVLGLAPALAQTNGGQVCIRAFEDRNANGTYDAGEPFITRGISVSIADNAGVIIRTAMLEDSSSASRGIVCFQDLEAGQYSVNVASADYVATTAEAFVVAVQASSIPEVFDFGAQVAVSEATAAPAEGSALANEEQQRALIQRLLLSAIGAAIVIGGLAVIGSFFYFLLFRPRRPRVAYPTYPTGVYPAHSTGSMPAVTPGSMPPVRPTTGSTPAVRPGTGPVPAVGSAETLPPRDVMPLDDEPEVSPDDDTGRFRPPSADPPRDL